LYKNVEWQNVHINWNWRHQNVAIPNCPTIPYPNQTYPNLIIFGYHLHNTCWGLSGGVRWNRHFTVRLLALENFRYILWPFGVFCGNFWCILW
jgi:hypothetical protein